MYLFHCKIKEMIKNKILFFNNPNYIVDHSTNILIPGLMNKPFKDAEI
jgi:hypothetical protein